MLKIAFLLVGLAVAQDTAIFRDDQLRLAFSYPKTWTSSKKKDITTFNIPLEGTTDKATLEVSRALFRSEPDIWQLVQTHANKQMNREVVQQWEQEILGVPMLLTQIRYSDKGTVQSSLTALLYTRTPNKLLLRLTAPDSDFDKAKFVFEETIQTLRAIGEGELLPEDPTKPAVAPPDPKEKIDLRPPKKTTFADEPTKKAPVLGPVVVDLEVSGRKMQSRLPQGWTFDEVKDGGFVAKHASLSAPVRILIHSVLDSDPPKNALFKRSSETLSLYKKVNKREDVVDRATKGGMNLSYIWRTGETADGSASSLDATLGNDTHYAIVQYRTSIEGDRRLLEELLSILSVSPAP